LEKIEKISNYVIRIPNKKPGKSPSNCTAPPTAPDSTNTPPSLSTHSPDFDSSQYTHSNVYALSK
jgi:hypothetical protein